MKWPFVTRSVHDLEVLRRDGEIVELTEQRDYWRTRAERLTDAALARANAIHEPTMVDRKPPTGKENPAAVLVAAMGITEIRSDKGKAEHAQR